MGWWTRAEVYRHGAFGVSLRVPKDFSGDADMARSRDGIVSAWKGAIGSAFALLVLEHVDAVESETTDDAAAERIVDAALIGAHCDAVERENVRWHDRTLSAIVGLVKGDVYREAHAVIDVPLIAGGALRIRLSTAAAQREGLSRTLSTLVSTVTARKPAR